MSGPTSYQRIRLALEQYDHDPAVCLIANDNNQVPLIWRGTDVQVEVAHFVDGTLITDVSNIDALTLEIHDPADPDGAALFQQILAAGDIKQDLTSEDWTGGAAADAHGVFTLPAADTQLDMTDAVDNVKGFPMVIHAATTDSPDHFLTWGWTQLNVEEDGAQNGLGVVTAPDPNYRLQSGQLQLYNPTTGLWHAIGIEGAAGTVSFIVDQTGEA